MTRERTKQVKKTSAFTLIEMVMVIAIIALIVAIAIPSLNTAKATTEQTSAEARAKVLNEARDRAILKGAGGYETRDQWNAAFGTDGTNAAAFLLSNNLVRVNN